MIWMNPCRAASGAEMKKSARVPSRDSRQAKLTLFKPVNPEASRIFIQGMAGNGTGGVRVRFRRRNVGQHVKKGPGVEPAVIQRLAVKLRKPVGGENRDCHSNKGWNRPSTARRQVQRPILSCRQSAAIGTGRQTVCRAGTACFPCPVPERAGPPGKCWRARRERHCWKASPRKMECRAWFRCGAVCPPAAHFFRRPARLVLSRPLLFPASSSNSRRRGLTVIGAVPAVLGDGERKLALRQVGEVIEFHAQIVFQRRDEFRIPFGHEFVVKRFHRRVIPEQPLGRLMAGGPQRGAIGHGRAETACPPAADFPRAESRPAGARQ